MHQHQCSAVALLALLHLSACRMYYIIPRSPGEAACPNNNTCVILNKVANSSHYFDSNTTLNFLPGNHSLDVEISISNISELRMLTNDSPASSTNLTVTILCDSRARFNIEVVNKVFINGLSFIGCGDNTFSKVDQIVIEDSTFHGTEYSSTALVLNGITSASIIRNAFVFNQIGSYHSIAYGNVSRVGGALVATMTSNVSIDNSMFQNNSADHGGALYAEVGSRIMLKNCLFSRNSAVSNGGSIHAQQSIISINKCAFSDNRGSNGIQVISLLSGASAITETNFTNNSEVILMTLGSIMIKDCNFAHNKVPVSTVFSEASALIDINYGGILLVYTSQVTMTNNTFYANEAAESGGILVFVNATLMTNGNMELLENAAFEGVVVLVDSSALFNGPIKFKNNLGALSVLTSSVEFADITLFLNNTPSTRDHDTIRGGAATVYFGTLNFTGPIANFTDNNAINGGALYAAESTIYISSEVAITNNVAQNVGGGIFIYNTFLYILSNMTISGNQAEYGGGIHILSSAIVLTSSAESTFHSLTLASNTAIHLGGGLFFSSNSNLYIYHLDPRPHNITTILASNNAESGGAIYVRDDTNLALCEADSFAELTVNSECFFQVVDFYRQSGTLRLNFESNTANASGSVMFGGLLDRCLVTRLASSSFFDTDLGSSSIQSNGISYLLNVSNLENLSSIASYPVSICFCSGNQPNCSLQVQPIEVQKGRNFTVSVIALDQAGHPLNATIITTLQSPTGGLGEGQQSQMIGGYCTDLTLSVTSIEDYEEVIVYADGSCGDAGPSRRTIDVTFSKCLCPIGFDVNLQQTSICECVCTLEPRIARHISNCSTKEGAFTKTDNSWIDYENNTGFIISPSCPYDYCHPFASVSINLNIPNGANSQCANNRAGILCGGCQLNFSLSVGQSRCIKCDNIWPVYTTFMTLAGLIVGILLVILILFLNLTVTTGTINGFIFSANILKAIFPFPRDGYQTYLISFLNLDAGLDACYYDGYNAYHRTWFELGFPLYLIFIVVMVIIISEYSSRFARFIGKRNPLETLATLIFLSYAKVLQFTINALSFGVLEYPNGFCETVWLPDANIGYFDVKHAIMFTVAIATLIVVFFYTLLLFSWQWILRCPSWKVFALIRNTKFHSFIEMYHSPHNMRHRYWTGLLLFIRMIVYLVAVLTTSSDSTAKHLAIISILTALSVIKNLRVRVYNKWPVDILESVLIANTIILTAAAWYALNTDNHQVSIAATYTSTVIMVSLLIGVIAYHINYYVLKGKFDIQKQLTQLSIKIHQQSQSAENRDNGDNQDQQETTIDYPRPLHRLHLDRHNSTLYVMDSPTESDYRELHLQQQSEMSAEASEVEQEPAPVEPTFSVLLAPSPIPEES